MNRNSPTNRFGFSQTSLHSNSIDTEQPQANIPKHKHSTPAHPNSQHPSSRPRTSNYSSHPISSLKNQLYDLQNDFNQIFLKEDSYKQDYKPSEHYKPAATRKKQTLYQDDFDSSKYSSTDILAIEEQNLSLKSQMKHMQVRFRIKKQQYQQTIKVLYRKIEGMAEQLETNQESLMVCKLELENEMEMIREQLRGKKEAEISLEDYGELVEINGNLKEEIQCYLKSIDEMKMGLEIQYRKAGEHQRDRLAALETIQRLEQTVKKETISKESLQKQMQQKSQENIKLIKSIKQLEQTNKALNQKLSSQATTLEEVVSLESHQQLHDQNVSLQKQVLEYLQTIGEINAECFMFKNNYQLLADQHKRCISTPPVQPEAVLKLREQNIRQKEIMEDMMKFIKQMEEVKGKLEGDREAMLNDIVYLEKELARREEGHNSMRVLIAEKQNQIIELKKYMEREIQARRLSSLFEDKASKEVNGTVFIQSQQITEEVLKDFDGLLNSPKINSKQRTPLFRQISQHIEINDLKKYINGDQNPHELAVSIIVSENKSEVLEANQQTSTLRDESLLIDNLSGLSNAAHPNQSLQQF